MKLGIFAKTFGRPTVEEVFAAVGRRHLRFIQFNFASAGLPSLPDSLHPILLQQIERAAAKQRLTISAVSATFNMIHPDPAVRRAGLRRLSVIGAGCATLKTGLLTLCTGTRDPDDMWRAHPDNNTPEAWKDLVVTMTKALTAADKYNLTLGVEPELGNVINSAPQARRLLDEFRSPRLKIVMDPANLIQRSDFGRMKEILEDAFSVLGEDLVLAHAKELRPDGHPGGLPLGAGVLEWDQYLGLLRQARYAGPIIMHGFEESEVEASVKFLRGRLGSKER